MSLRGEEGALALRVRVAGTKGKGADMARGHGCAGGLAGLLLGFLSVAVATAGEIRPFRGPSPLAAGYAHSLALTSDGRIVAWGAGDEGQTTVPPPNAGFVSVAAGLHHSLGLKADGHVVAFGRDDYGQCRPPAAAVFTAVAGGAEHSLGLQPDGSIVAWGRSVEGQRTVPAPNADFVALATAGCAYHSLGLKADGRIVAWGYNGDGETNVPEPNIGFVAVAAGAGHSLGLKADGHIVAWGWNDCGETNVPAPNADFVAVTAGGHHSLALRSDGSVVAWGNNTYGQTNVPEPNADFVAVAAGYYHSMGLKADGSVVCWGQSSLDLLAVPPPNTGFGQQSGVLPARGPAVGGTTVTITGRNLGDGTDVTRVMLCGVEAAIVTQYYATVVVRTGVAPAATNGEVVVVSTSCGRSALTNGFTYFSLPMVVTRPVTGISATRVLAAGDVLHDGYAPVSARGVCWGTAPDPTCADTVVASGSGVGAFGGVPLTGLSSGGRYHVRAWAQNAVGIAYGADVAFTTFWVVKASAAPRGVIVPRGSYDVADGGAAGFTIAPDTGYRIADVRVDGRSVGAVDRYAFAAVTNNHAIHATFSGVGPWFGASPLAGGFGHSLGLRRDGRIAAWGRNTRGQAGPPGTNEDFVAVAAAGDYSLGLKSDGRVVAWGSSDNDLTIVPAPNSGFVAVAAGITAALGLQSDGRIVGWGSNADILDSVPTPNADVVAVAVGDGHALAVTSDGRVQAWGRDGSGETTVPSPNADFVAVAAGASHSLGLKASGCIVAWGLSTHGETNVPPPNADFVGVAAGASHSLGLMADGRIVAWGYNGFGQTDVPAPNADFVAVAAGRYHSLGLKSDGRIVVWGDGAYGQGTIPIPNADYGQPSGVMPTCGPLQGGATVTILGSNLGNGADVTSVTLCGVPAAIVTQSAWRVVVRTGPTATPTNGDVIVRSTSFGSSTGRQAYAYGALPEVETWPVTNITVSSALGGGAVVAEGTSPVTGRGLCWGTTIDPTVSDNVVVSGSGAGSFAGVPLSGLHPNVRYHARAWARSAIGVAYGTDAVFNTHCSVTASGGRFGMIVPSGVVDMENGGAVSFTLAPDTGCRIADVLVDGVSIGATNRYTFHDVVSNHTIEARFARAVARWRFAVLADSGDADLSSTGIFAEIAQAIASDEPDLVIFPGDLVLSPSVAGFQQWTNLLAPVIRAGIGLYPVRGNHEQGDVVAANWRAAFTALPTNGPPGEVGLTYSFGHLNATFIGLDQLVAPYRVNQAWLTAQLAVHTQQHVFVFGHMPAFPTSYHVGSSLDKYPTERNTFWNCLATNCVRAYFCGHEHFYDRARADDGNSNSADDVYQYIVGTGGSPFYPDRGYRGDNGTWLPVREVHTNAYGYVLAEVDGGEVTLTLKRRTAAGVFVPDAVTVLTAMHNLTASAEPHGRIAPNGLVRAVDGDDLTYTITPAAGYQVANVWVDGAAIGATNRYTFANVARRHSLRARFWAIGPWTGRQPLAAGTFHSVGLKLNGQIVAWGRAVSGATAVPPPNADFVAVAGAGWGRGGVHSFGLKSDGRIVAWGDNSWRQSDVPVPNADFVSLAEIGTHALGLKADGRIIAWGYNSSGQTTVPAPNADFVAVAAGGSHSLGLKADGSVVAWGSNTSGGQATVPAPNADFVAVAAGGSHSLGLKADGSVVAWGSNASGQTTVPAPNAFFVAVAAGEKHSLGLKADGNIVAWGSNSYGQSAVPAPNANFGAIAAGYAHSLGLKADGSIVAWGQNTYAQLNVPAPNTGFGLPSGIMPPRGALEGGTEVMIQGWNLGDGADVTNVTLCGVAATIVSQSPLAVIVRTGPASVPTNGDVVVCSAGYGRIALARGFSYFNETYTPHGTPQAWLDKYGLTSDTSDTDGDDMPEWAEYKAGTVPALNTSRLSITNVSTTVAPGGAGIVLQWPSVFGRTYAVDRATNGVYTNFVPLATNLPATPPGNVHTDSAAVPPRAAYRIRLTP